MRKNFLNPNFTFIDRKKGFDPCCNRLKHFLNLSFFYTFLMSEKMFYAPPPTFSEKIGPPETKFCPGPPNFSVRPCTYDMRDTFWRT